MADPSHTPAERDPENGTEPVSAGPHDQPGTGRGAVFVLVAVLAVLALLMPLAWAFGALATVGAAIGRAALIGLWIVWALVLVGVGAILRSMWKRAA